LKATLEEDVYRIVKDLPKGTMPVLPFQWSGFMDDNFINGANGSGFYSPLYEMSGITVWGG
jgi:hypothetical protein